MDGAALSGADAKPFPLVRYDAMGRAIAAAYEVDEVKDVRDQTLAVEGYSRQAKNIEAERRACEVRLRAERKAGELLREREKHAGGRPEKTGQSERPVSETRKLRDLGISKPQSSDWQRLASVPAPLFEAVLADPARPWSHCWHIAVVAVKRALYSITSSARASSACGTVRPSALAVLMLITSSNVVGCSTGRSAGLAPFRMRPTLAPNPRNDARGCAP